MTATLSAVVIDCTEPAALAEFYRKVTGWDITSSDADAAYLSENGAIQLGFQRIANYSPPGWPDDAKHFHLDFTVDDVAAAVRELLTLGATKPQFQPGGDGWTVLADPEGHPFCLVSEN
jgi:predicted enzyme related to lactoylglutathione lyase